MQYTILNCFTITRSNAQKEQQEEQTVTKNY